MKFSRSIVIFLFVSATLSAFYFALKRTDGNVWAAIMFTIYYLGVKLNLIPVNFPLELDQFQSNPQLESSVHIVDPRQYHPYMSLYNDYRPSGLYMYKSEQLVPQDYVSYHSQSVSELSLWVYMMDEQFRRTPEVSKLIKELRGGSLTTTLMGNAIFLAVLYGIWILSSGTQGFVTPPQNPGWGLPGGLYDPPGLVRPVDCGTQLHAGSPTQSLKTWEGRNQPNSKDRWFLVESRPELVMRRGQSKFKTKDHGALAGLPYSIKKNGSTSTLKTEENVNIFMDAVEEIVYDPNSLWFEEGTYQGGTNREVKSINIYNEKHNRIVVFLRSTGEFITFCEPTLDELEDLSQTANFGGQDNWFSSTPKNMPPQQEFVSDFTSVNSFESDVMSITPISSMDENSSPNQKVTPLNSFESDVLGITPVDLDWQI